MNYCIVAFAIVIIISTVQWFVDGRKNFHGPSIDTEAMAAAGAVSEGLGLAVGDSRADTNGASDANVKDRGEFDGESAAKKAV
jgi:hypothetical protein